jgi:subtilisin family serine protease
MHRATRIHKEPEMKLNRVSIAILALVSALATSAVAADERRSYIVQLSDKPVATYSGGLPGLAATQPPAGQRLDVDASMVQDYIQYLDTQRASVIGSVAAANITHQYTVVFNGFAAQLTDAEVRALKKNAGVATITADAILQPDTSYTPQFIGLDQAGGLWQQLGGQGAAGENIVIGIVDSGIWPENPSFADRVDANGVPSHSGASVVYGAAPVTWKGLCVIGEGFSGSNCNNKLIGARYFKPAGQTLHWTEFLSARDSVAGAEGQGGHGTHTASTAGGNANVKVVNAGVPMGTVSGIAPRARIAAYKVCWTDGATGRNGCATSSSVAAIEQAVKDGVNVINFSIGPGAGGGAFNEATEVAFLGAASAGVFVSTSAGNGGPTSTTVAPTAHISPWLTSVGNATHNRLYVATVSLGNGATLDGASSNASSASAPLILASDAGLAGVDPADINLARCFGATDGVAALLDPAKVSGKILVCDRGANVLVNKSANAKVAGAVGVIIANVIVTNNAILNQAHSLSTVHLKVADGTILKSYMAGNPAAATAALGGVKTVVDPTVAAPIMAGGSSRGPNVANANILKPDLSAPGTDILAAVTADLTQAQRNAVALGGVAPVTDWEFYSGTSMASPHVAGIAAMLKQLHPSWTPAAIKSAMMTTTRTTLPDGLNGSIAWDSSARTTGTLPWAQGAGFIVPNSAADPGLVYDATEIDYARFLCGINAQVYSPATCRAIGVVAAYNLNLASLTAANVLGSLTMTRTVTNVGTVGATYNLAQAEVPGYAVVVTPSVLTLAPGGKAGFSVKLTRTTAPLATWAYGSLVWSDGVHTVRSPLTARGTALAAPAVVGSEATTGNLVMTIGTGVSGAIGHVKSGVLPAAQEERVIGQATTDSATDLATCRAGGGAGVNVHSFSVAAGTLAARWSLFDADTGSGAGSDLDLIVIKPDATIASSGNGGSNERVQLDAPAAGVYKVCVIGYEPAGGAATYKLSSWLLAPGASNGDFKVLMPSTAFIGKTMSVTMSWQNLAPGVRHLGGVKFVQGDVALGTTLLEVDTDDPVPSAVPSRAPSQVLTR